ncbi:LemA family protein [Aurantiacibacter gangjinensis]|uniref:Membrane protein n=1 Tax=Aurantiacibacter gangjinensis TaxID=502682 RepID=A0A0G9MRF5_9SPHN|nr:LemA family protein [Aurantiacibacter gangjinensis]APE26850.1 LemA family protein [Aurantiacibacter gangjinensis]KLE33326.1 membrane protein [Aurantiacibacter gangjinensis]
MLKRISMLFALILGSVALASCGINSVPTKEEAAKAQWGNVESALQRRSDLIPGLVEIAQAEAISERNILTEVIDARARATAINITTDDLSDPETFENFQASQNQLTQALGQLRTVIESYPEISSSAAWADLRVALDEANNLVNTERVRYNDAARDYNTEIRTFPSTIGANIIHGSEPLEYFEASETDNPDVDLSRIIDEE